jgi:2-polyprenyl-3-methyl-5-hydroxy-6-metoxy-1,4-benzoquinol methylase
MYVYALALRDVVYEGYLVNRRKRYDRFLSDNLWDFEKPSCIDRYQKVLEVVEKHMPLPWGDVAEVGCGVGVFTASLVERGARVAASDISQVALERTRARCGDAANLELRVVDLERDVLEGEYDVVFAMDVLECIHGRSTIEAATNKVANAVRPGGLLLVTMSRLPEMIGHSRLWFQLIEGAEAMFAFLNGRYGLTLLERRDEERYSIAVFRRQGVTR